MDDMMYFLEYIHVLTQKNIIKWHNNVGYLLKDKNASILGGFIHLKFSNLPSTLEVSDICIDLSGSSPSLIFSCIERKLYDYNLLSPTAREIFTSIKSYVHRTSLHEQLKEIYEQRAY